MAFPPLVSSSPPPLDNFGDSEEDNDDEFGDFTAGGIDGKIQENQSFHHVNCNTRLGVEFDQK